MNLRDVLTGAVVMAPMTKGSNLPYRRLCVELGARVTMSEMTVARRLTQDRRNEFALIRRATDEQCFGVQLAGNKPEEMAWAAALVASRGADFVDVNLGCPIDYFTSKGLGAALGERRIAVVEKVRDVAEEQRRCERRRRFGVDRDDTCAARADFVERLHERGHVEVVAQDLPVRLEQRRKRPEA